MKQLPWRAVFAIELFGGEKNTSNPYWILAAANVDNGRTVLAGRLIVAGCVVALPIAGSEWTRGYETLAILVVGAVGLVGLGLLWIPEMSEGLDRARRSRSSIPSSRTEVGESGGSALSKEESVLRNLRFGAGGIAALGFGLSIVTDEVVWSIVAFIGAVALLCVVLLERRRR